MTRSSDSHRTRLMIGLGGWFAGIAAVLSFATWSTMGNPPLASAVLAAIAAFWWGLGGLMLGHLEATADPMHPWFRPKPPQGQGGPVVAPEAPQGSSSNI